MGEKLFGGVNKSDQEITEKEGWRVRVTVIMIKS